MCAAHSGNNGDESETARRELQIKRAKAEAARLLAKARALEAELAEEAQQDSKRTGRKPPAASGAEDAKAAARPAPSKRPPKRPVEKKAPAAAVPKDRRAPERPQSGVSAEQPAARSRFWRDWSSWTVSAVFHAVLLIVLGLSWMTLAREDGRNPLMAFIEGAEAEELEESLLENLDLEVEAMQAVPVNVTDPGEAALGEIVGIEADVLDVEGSLAAADSFADIGTPWGTEGKGYASSGTGLGGAEFYGVKAAGHRFVFVVDNSLSMKEGRFEAACIELYKSVCRMKAKQQLYVFFFSDTAYPLFYPNTVREMVPATTRNQYRLEAWLRTIELVLHTNAQGAVEKALAMKPDAIYILTDGAFTDNTYRYLMKLEPARTSIHTVGMELKREHGRHLQEIAKRHHGTYRLVHVDPRIRMMVGKKSRPRHNKPGPVWGIALHKLGKPGAKKAGGRQGGGKQGGKKGGGGKGQGRKKAKQQ